jgi:hypothetical protein
MTAPLLLAAALAAPPAAGGGLPCAACVRWQVTAAQASRLLEGPASLTGIALLLPADAAPHAAALRARGASVDLLLADDGDVSPAERAYGMKSTATLLRARHPGLRIGAEAAAGVPAELGAYLDFELVSAAADAAPERWLRTAGRTAADVLAATERTGGPVVAHWPGPGEPEDAPFALARASDALGTALAPLPGAKVDCEAATPGSGPGCDAEPFLAGGGDAVVIVRPGTAVRAVVLRASGSPAGAGEPLTTARVHELDAPYEVRDARATALDGALRVEVAAEQAFLLHVPGWARAHGLFGADVDVVAGRSLTVEEVVARHQAWALRQRDAVPRSIATGSLVIAFQSPGLSAPVVVTADITTYSSPAGTELEQRGLRLNGLVLDGSEVPRLPLLEPERVASAPLSLTLDRTYRYRLEGRERRAGRECYRVAFEPAAAGGPSLRGRAWIEAGEFGLVRVEAVQTGLRGAFVSSQQTDERAPLEHDGRTLWLPSRTEVHQVYEGAGRRTPVDRVLVFARQEPDPADFDQRLAAARAGDAVMLRETARGFEYLRKPRGSERTEAGRDARVPAGKATSVRTVALGLLVDPNVGDPLPFAGAGYTDFDLFGGGTQLSAFLAGAFAQLSWSAPSLRGSPWRLDAAGLASFVEYNDRVFRRGVEQYAENLRQRPARLALDLSRPLGGRWRARAGYELEYTRLRRSDLTDAGFREPSSVLAHGLRAALDVQRGPWTASAWWRPARRAHWRGWGYADAAEAAAAPAIYHRYGVTAARTVIASERTSFRVEVAAMAGRGLDRFSYYSFDAFENRLTGYPTASVRYDRGLVARSAFVWRARPALRLQGFADAARVRDAGYGFEARTLLGLGAGLEAALPWRTLLAVEWGHGVQGRDREGRPGTHTLRVTAYRLF